MLKKTILAVSGGIDSMVLLDWFVNGRVNFKSDLIVAHFDHGTRESSCDDADFVRQKCLDLNIRFEEGSAQLGENVSEEMARKKRYEFLFGLAKKYDAEIFTAHHLDDLVESIAINLTRGTGWRGLAVLDAGKVHRPFLDATYAPDEYKRLVPMTKQEIYKYAFEHNVSFREDPTNSSDEYLRNRLRQSLKSLNCKEQFYELWQRQKKIKTEIDQFVQKLLPKDAVWQRQWFTELDDGIAIELLKAGLSEINIRLTRPQLLHLLSAIREYAPGKYFNLPDDKLLMIDKETFTLRLD